MDMISPTPCNGYTTFWFTSKGVVAADLSSGMAKRLPQNRLLVKPQTVRWTVCNQRQAGNGTPVAEGQTLGASVCREIHQVFYRLGSLAVKVLERVDVEGVGIPPANLVAVDEIE